MAFEKLKKFIGDEDDETIVTKSGKNNGEGNEYYSSKDGFKDLTGSGNKMILLEPRAYSESQQIADYLKARNAVVVNMKRVTPDKAKRIVDFLSGTLYAIGGDLQKLGNGIFLCTPNNINVEGKITNEVDKPKSKKEDNELDW